MLCYHEDARACLSVAAASRHLHGAERSAAAAAADASPRRRRCPAPMLAQSQTCFFLVRANQSPGNFFTRKEQTQMARVSSKQPRESGSSRARGACHQRGERYCRRLPYCSKYGNPHKITHPGGDISGFKKYDHRCEIVWGVWYVMGGCYLVWIMVPEKDEIVNETPFRLPSSLCNPELTRLPILPRRCNCRDSCQGGRRRGYCCR